jgi:hypothetical protein
LDPSRACDGRLFQSPELSCRKAFLKRWNPKVYVWLLMRSVQSRLSETFVDQVPRLHHIVFPVGSGSLYRISPAAPVGPVMDAPVGPVIDAPVGPVIDAPVGPVIDVPVGPVGPKSDPSSGMILAPGGLPVRTMPE